MGRKGLQSELARDRRPATSESVRAAASTEAAGTRASAVPAANIEDLSGGGLSRTVEALHPSQCRGLPECAMANFAGEKIKTRTADRRTMRSAAIPGSLTGS